MRRQFVETIERCLIQDATFDRMRPADHACGLQSLLACSGLPNDFLTALRTAVEKGFTLRRMLPPLDCELTDEWLGARWWLVHRSQLAQASTWSGIVASRLNRNDPSYGEWPAWIEAALRSLARDHQTLLLVPETTTAAIIQPLARCAQLNCVQMQLPRSESATLSAWLEQVLEQIPKASSESVANATLWSSPAWRAAASNFQSRPLRDRVVVTLAHRLLALSIRPQGNIAELLKQRLQDTRFPEGTVSVRVADKSDESQPDWLSRRTVGWYLPARMRLPPAPLANGCPLMTRCRASSASKPPLLQWTADARMVQSSSLDYLSHCVRGDEGDAFRHGSSSAVIQAIALGRLRPTSAYETLLKILSTGRLRASSKLLRSGASAVSFTAMPLDELLSRRRYQPHLGRWDWEPYGLLIRRAALEQLGARPVIYGDELLYDELDAQDRPYFQPARRRSARNSEDDWQAEQEWRLADDVHLNELPRESIVLFVGNITQAQSLAACCPWPVIWQPADQTRRSLTAANYRRRSSARTSKN